MRPRVLALGAACVVAGTAVGFLLGKNAAVSAPPDAVRSTPRDAATITELRELSARVARLQETVASLRVPTDRQPMPVPLPANAEAAPPELEPLVARLARLVERLAGATSSQMHEALRMARLQRPQPDLAAAEVLHAHLRDSKAMGPAERLAAEREWLLLGMDEVVLRLGMPSEVAGAAPGEIYWSYQRTEGDVAVGFHFRDGLVVDVHDG